MGRIKQNINTLNTNIKGENFLPFVILTNETLFFESTQDMINYLHVSRNSVCKNKLNDYKIEKI